jgi:hypothetical protein
MGACSNIACGLGRYPIVQVKTIPKMMWIHEESLNRHNIVWGQKEIREQAREFHYLVPPKKLALGTQECKVTVIDSLKTV